MQTLAGLQATLHFSFSAFQPFSFYSEGLDLPALCEQSAGFLHRKEVIQPQVPLRLPCYDFIPVTSYTLGPCLLAVGSCTSGTSDFHDVTGGVYKARERIHGAVADAPLLAIPTSWSRVADSNPDWDRLSGIGSTSRLGNPLYRPL